MDRRFRTIGEDAPLLSGDEGQAGERLLRPAVSCPRCGAFPPVRVTQSIVEEAQGWPPETRLATYQCHRRGCGLIYDLTAASFQNAS